MHNLNFSESLQHQPFDHTSSRSHQYLFVKTAKVMTDLRQVAWLLCEILWSRTSLSHHERTRETSGGPGCWHQFWVTADKDDLSQSSCFLCPWAHQRFILSVSLSWEASTLVYSLPHCLSTQQCVASDLYHRNNTNLALFFFVFLILAQSVYPPFAAQAFLCITHPLHFFPSLQNLLSFMLLL